MTRNDTIFKILFAIEIALIPLTMAAYLLMPVWTIGVFVAGILVSKIWMELFKEKENKNHKIIMKIGNILTIAVLVVFFAVQGYVNLALAIVIAVLAVLMNVFKLLLNKETMPEMIDAVDSCYILFECLTFIAFSFVVFYQLVANIALFALLLTAVASVAYKIYYILKYKNGMNKIKNLFRRK